MPDDPAGEDVIDDDEADHDVPVDLTILHEVLDFEERSKLGPNS